MTSRVEVVEDLQIESAQRIARRKRASPRVWVLRMLALAAVFGLAGWGLPRNPAVKEWRVLRVSLAHLASGLTTAAFGQLREFAGTHPKDPQAHLILGKFYATQRSMRRAGEEFSLAVELDPKSADGWASLAGSRDAMGQLDSARDAIER